MIPVLYKHIIRLLFTWIKAKKSVILVMCIVKLYKMLNTTYIYSFIF